MILLNWKLENLKHLINSTGQFQLGRTEVNREHTWSISRNLENENARGALAIAGKLVVPIIARFSTFDKRHRVFSFSPVRMGFHESVSRPHVQPLNDTRALWLDFPLEHTCFHSRLTWLSFWPFSVPGVALAKCKHLRYSPELSSFCAKV